MDTDRNYSKSSVTNLKEIEAYPIPKLTKSSLEEIFMLLRRNQGKHLVSGVGSATAIIHLAVTNHTYDENEWTLIAPTIVELFRIILDSIINNNRFLKSESRVRIISDAAQLLMSLGQQACILQSLFMDRNGAQLLKLICWEELNFIVRRDILIRFKNFVVHLPLARMRSFSWSLENSIKLSLIKLLITCQDYETQEHTTELLVRFALTHRDWRNVLKSWFSVGFPQIAKATVLISCPGFFASCRRFLNVLNDMESLNSQVYSLPCLYAEDRNHIQIQKPSKYDELWLDCSPRTTDIRLLSQQDDGRMFKFSVNLSNVQSIKCEPLSWPHPNGKEKCCRLLIIHSVPPGTKASPSMLMVLLKKDRRFETLENNFLKTIYSECYESTRTGPQKASHSSKASYVSSSSSMFTSMLNLTWSTIKSDGNTIVPRLSSSLITYGRKRITASTPENIENKDVTSAQNPKHEGIRKSVKNALKDQEEVIKKETSSMSSENRNNVTSQENVYREVENSESTEKITENYIFQSDEHVEALPSNEKAIPLVNSGQIRALLHFNTPKLFSVDTKLGSLTKTNELEGPQPSTSQQSGLKNKHLNDCKTPHPSQVPLKSLSPMMSRSQNAKASRKSFRIKKKVNYKDLSSSLCSTEFAKIYSSGDVIQGKPIKKGSRKKKYSQLPISSAIAEPRLLGELSTSAPTLPAPFGSKPTMKCATGIQPNCVNSKNNCVNQSIDMTKMLKSSCPKEVFTPQCPRAWPDEDRQLPAIQAFTQTDMLELNKGIPGNSKSLSTQHELPMDCQLQRKIVSVSGRLREEIESLHTQNQSEYASIMKTVEASLSTSVDVMKTIKNECSNIAQCATNMKSACEKWIARFEEL